MVVFFGEISPWKRKGTEIAIDLSGLCKGQAIFSGNGEAVDVQDASSHGDRLDDFSE